MYSRILPAPACLALLLAACGLSATATAGDRLTVNFDRDWRFHLGNVDNGQDANLDDSAWRQLDVPHDWSIEGGEAGQRPHLPVLGIVAGKWQFHRGDNPDWKKPAIKTEGWETVQLPNWWNDHSGYNDEHCYGWYRRAIQVPKEMQGKTILLNLGRIDDCDQTFFNGKKIGATGHMPPNYATAWETVRLYKLDPKLVRPGENVVAVRVYNGESKGGMYDAGAAQFECEGPFDPLSPAGDGGGYLNGGIGWYRKTFSWSSGLSREEPAKAGSPTGSPEAKDRRTWIEFDGVYMDSEMWLNGKRLGRHPYGYTSFYYDLTEALKPEGKNVLAVRLNVSQPCSRWYSGAGIFRHVRLVAVEPVHVAHWGTYVTTPLVTPDSADVKIATRVENQGAAAAEAQLWTEIIAPDGKVLRASAEPLKRVLAPGGDTTFVETVSIGQPKLWSPSSPQLYVATSHVTVAGQTADFVTTNFGIRSVEFTKDRGMLINGRRVPVNGVCDHHDLGCLGSAVHARGIQRQLQILKGMGCNAIRTSHNPPDPALLDLCDALGFVVMDEAFDEWKAGKTPLGYGRFFDEWSERDLVSMLHRDRNHPCVVLWSIGNEIPEQGAKNAYEMSKRLVNICRREDPTRPTTSACNNSGAADHTGFARPLGVFGINYSIGAYRQFKDKYRLIGSETASALSTRGEYGLKLGKNGKLEIQREFDHQVTSYDLAAPGWGYIAETDLLALRHCAVGRGRVRVDRLRLHRRADALSLAVAELLLRHYRPGRFPQGPLLLLPQRLAAGAVGPPPAPLDLAGTGRQGGPRVGRHELRYRGTFPQRQVARRTKARPRQVAARRLVGALHRRGPAGGGEEGREGSGRERGPHGRQAEAARAAARPRKVRRRRRRPFLRRGPRA